MGRRRFSVIPRMGEMCICTPTDATHSGPRVGLLARCLRSRRSLFLEPGVSVLACLEAALMVVTADTVVRRHQADFRTYWSTGA
jgi:hypothetical protein